MSNRVPGNPAASVADLDHAVTVRGRLGLGLIAIAIAILGLVLWGLATRPVEEQITQCGFDTHGAYAKVRINNTALLGGEHSQPVIVQFHIDDEVAHYKEGEDSYYAVDYTVARVPAHGHVMAVVHAGFPPHGSLRDPTAADLRIKGETVYRWQGPYGGDRIVTRKFALQHSRRTLKETVPDDRNSLDCTIVDEEDFE